jgi:hypothetical protein
MTVLASYIPFGHEKPAQKSLRAQPYVGKPHVPGVDIVILKLDVACCVPDDTVNVNGYTPAVIGVPVILMLCVGDVNTKPGGKPPDDTLQPNGALPPEEFTVHVYVALVKPLPHT